MVKKLGSAGDTIIEVLIAIAVESSVLGIAYSIMNRNMQVMRDNQERTEASKIAQSQLELLRVALAGSGRSVVESNGAAAFCMTSSTTTDGIADTDNFDDYEDTGCVNGLYHTSMRLNNSDGYTVTVKWDALGGGRSEVVMAYRVDQ